MKNTYEKLSFKISKKLTRAYTTSFAIGIRFLDKKFHAPIYAIYGFVRLADEIVDTFHQHDKELLLDEFKEDTYKALERGISMNPVLQSFQEVVRKYNIDHELIDTFLKSMYFDIEKKSYSDDQYREYILGSAEVVGLMCLRVFVGGDQDKYKKLKPHAMKLGSAYQKINFLRDIKADAQELGRMYFPGLTMENFDEKAKKDIEQNIEQDFREGFEGIRLLPKEAGFGVYVSYIYYYKLFKKIQSLPPAVVASQRVRVPDGQKYYLLFTSYLRFNMNML